MNCPDNDHLQQTPMLDYDHTSLQALIKAKRWGELSPYDAVGAIYTFVRDDIRFGYNIDDTIPASQVQH
jgi:transglutaminase-like putative cysteine protease